MRNRENFPAFATNPEILSKVRERSANHGHIHHKIDEPLSSPWGLFLRDLWEVGGLGTALLVIFVVAYMIAQGA